MSYKTLSSDKVSDIVNRMGIYMPTQELEAFVNTMDDVAGANKDAVEDLVQRAEMSASEAQQDADTAFASAQVAATAAENAATNAAALATSKIDSALDQFEADADVVLAGIGYLPPVVFESGLNVNSTRFTVTESGVTYAPIADAIPFTTTGTFNPGQWRVVQGDINLRSDLADPTGGGALVAFRQSGAGAVTRSLLEKAREVAVSFEDFGAVGNGTSDDSLAIQRAINEVSARGGGVVSSAAREYHIGATGIIVPPTVQLQMHPDAALIYTGAGDALTLDCTSTLVTTQVCHRVCVRKPNPDWHSSRGATDTGSRGVIFKNAGCAELHVSVRNFHQNLVLIGDGQGNAGNHVFLGDIRNGKSNILFLSSGSGYVNQNTFYGGRVRHDGSFGGAGTVGLDMASDGNGCTFIGILLEGASVERVAVVGEAYNTWVNCRFEANVAGSFVFLPGSGRNTVVGGYNPRGLALFDQQGSKHNLILTEHGSQLHSGGTAGPGPAARFHATLANNGWEVVNEDGTQAIHAEMSKAGRMNVYREGGKTGAFPFPTVAISGPDRSVMVGLGDAAPMTALRGYNATTIDMPGLYRVYAARFSMPTYIDNADAVGGGAPVGSLYKTSTGEVRIVV